MPNALLTGVSGLIAHQRMLEVVGNNLANINTTGFKSQQTVFADLVFSTIRAASDSNSRSLGGTNPNQVGSGAKIAQITRNLSQGNVDATGRTFDYAISGEGYFVVNDGTKDYYTRAGAFSLDNSGLLVDPATGFRVQRFGPVGETVGINPGFQTPGDSGIVVPIGAAIPGQITSDLSLSGNLDSSATGPQAEVLSTTAPFQIGGGPANLATQLSNLDSNVAAYVAGDTLAISGVDVDGSPISTTFAVTNTTTVGDLITAINGQFVDATASLDASGNLLLTANNTGPASLALAINDAVGNTGITDWNVHDFVRTIIGKDADVVETSLEVYDVRGGARQVDLTFEKQNNDVWELTATVSPTEGTVIDGLVQQIQFREDGTFQQVSGSGLGGPQFIIQFSGMSSPQTINVGFGGNNQVGAITHLALDSSIEFDQNGFAPGNLTAVNISADGVIEGFASNGRRFPVAQLAIAKFANPLGLASDSDNYYVSTLNSGDPQIGNASSGARGSIVGGQLEQSNVDVAFEFTRLIVAQRGFSANARTITVADEVLEEVTNLVR